MSINAQPFQPQFKLIGNLAEDQILQYDVSEGAFVNTANSGGGGASGFTAIQNMGATGTAIHFGDAGTTLQLKKLIGGDNLTITDNGTGGLILAATNTDTIQTGTNLGTGTALFSAKNAGTHALEFKSLAVGAGLTITDNGSGTVTLVNSIAAGVAGADLTLSNLSNVVTARTNLDVYSKAEGNAKYHRTDANFLPATNNIYDVGSPTYKFNDIYAETFQGTAVLADQLTIAGTSGQVLTHNGTNWVAGAGSSVLSSASDMSSVAPANGQHLVWNSGTSLWTPASAGEGGGGYSDSAARAAISVSGDLSYNSSTGVITFSQNDAWSNITGTPTTLAGYGITDGGGSVTASSTDTFTNKSGNISQWTNDSSYLTSVPAQTFASLTSKPTTLAGYGITDGDAYTNSNVDAHLNVSGASANQVLKWTGTDYAWVTSTDSDTTYTAGSGLTLTGTEFTLTAAHFDGAYASLTGKPTTVSSFTNDSGYLTSVPAQAFSSLSGVQNATASEDNMVLYYDHSTTSFKWKSTGAHFDGIFASLSGKPTTLAGYGITDGGGDVTGASTTTFTNKSGAISQWTNDAGYLTSQTDSQTLSLSGSVLTISTGNNVDLGALTLDDFADVTVSGVSDGQFLTYDNSAGDWTNSSISIFSGVFADLTSKPTTLAGYGITDGAYANSNVDTHLNQSNPTSGYVLSWNGSDYAWVSNGASGAHFTTADARTSISATTGLSYNNGTGVLSLNAELSNLTNVASTAPSTGQVLKWNGSTWTPGTDENDDTVYTSFNTDFDTRLSAKTTSNLAEGTNKYYTDTRVRSALSVTGDLSYNASTGVISYTASAHYNNANVDTHINKASATSGQILSWDGSDYDWIANSGTPAWAAITSKPTTIAGFGITDAFDKTFNSLTGKPTTISGYGITDSLTASSSATLTNKSGNNSQWTNDTGYLTSVPAQSFSSLTGKPTSIAGYGISDAFDGAYASLSGKPTIPTNTNQLTNGSGFLTSESDTLDNVISRGAVTTTTAVIPFYYANQGAFPSASTYHGAMAHSHSDGAMYFAHGGNWNELANSATTLAGYGITDGLSLAGVDSHLNQSNPTSGYVLSWNGSDYAWVANAGGGSVTASSTTTFTNKSGAISQWTNDSSYLTSVPAQTFASLTYKPTTLSGYGITDGDPVTAGTGVQINSGVVSLNSALSGLTDVHTASPTNGQVLAWDNGNSRWAPAAAGGTLAMNDLTDVDTSGIASGQFLKWNGTSFIAATVSGGGASAIDDLSDVDTTTSAPSNGDVLTWVQADSEWAPAAPAGGGGGSGATIEYFKLNYATNGNLTSITNTTSGVAATITSATGGTVDITFSSTAYPPAGIMVYGYAYSANKYVIKPVSGDMTTKEVTGGGSSGSPIAFGSFGSVKMTLKLREADTGSSRSFGTTTHAWLMFTTV